MSENNDNIIIDVKSSGSMRNQLVSNLRNHVKQSRAERVAIIRDEGSRSVRPDMVRISIGDSEPQVVLLKNRSNVLNNEVLKLRSKYAKLLAESSND